MKLQKNLVSVVCVFFHKCIILAVQNYFLLVAMQIICDVIITLDLYCMIYIAFFFIFKHLVKMWAKRLTPRPLVFHLCFMISVDLNSKCAKYIIRRRQF